MMSICKDKLFRDIKWNSQANINVVVGEADTIVSDIVSWNMKESPYLEFLENKVYLVDKKSQYFPKDISELDIDRSFFEYEPTVNVSNGKKE